MSTNANGIEDLEQRAALLRSHVRESLEELERMSDERITQIPGGAGTIVRDSKAKDSPERERLEQRADEVRNDLVYRVGEMGRQARAKILPLVTVGGAALVLLTIGFGYMFYKTLRRERPGARSGRTRPWGRARRRRRGRRCDAARP